MDVKAMGTGAKAAVLVGCALLLGAAGYGIWAANQAAVPVGIASDPQAAPKAATSPVATASEPTAQPAPVAQPAAKPATDAAGAPPVPAPPEVVASLPQTTGPTFDLVRVEPDGQALVAGRAEPGSKVILRLDGDEISGTTATADGDFTVLFVLDPSIQPRMLTMGSILPGESEIIAEAKVALAPTTAPVIIAVAKPAANVAATSDVTATAGAVATEVPAGADSAAPPAPDAPAPDAPAPDAPAPDAPAALLVTKDGVNVLQSGDQPAVDAGPVDLALDTISYTPAGEVQLAGRGRPGAVLRVYLDNAPLIDVSVGEDGRWASTMPTIEPGLYTLRVDALAADGSVAARFETPFKRETPEALAAATQIEDPATAIAGATLAVEPQAVSGQTALPVPVSEMPSPDAAGLMTPAAISDQAVVPPPDQTGALQMKPVSITVQPGFTLWGIASEQFGDGVLYVQVFNANKDKIRDPNLIYPGQIFVIPATSE